MTLQLQFPKIDPVFLHLGPVQLRWYGLMYMISFIVGYFLLKRLSKAKKLPLTADDLYDLLFFLILGHEIPPFHEAGRLALYVVVLFALVSAVDYFRKFWTQIDDRFKAQERQRSILNQKQARRDVPTP